MGPDIGIEIDYLDAYPDEIVVWATQFFDQKLALYRVSLKDGSLVDSRVIHDNTILCADCMSMEDLNGDGKKELLLYMDEKDGSGKDRRKQAFSD